MRKEVFMKTRRALCLALALLVAVLCLFSCDGATGDGGNVGGGNVIYDADNEPVLIFAEDIDSEYKTTLYSAVRDASGSIPVFDNDSSEPVDHEIVVGQTSRAISQKAYRKLRTVQANDGEYRFVIYASGSSVAIAYENDSQDVTVERVIQYFVDNYVKGNATLKLDPGVVYSSVVDPVDILKAEDEAYKAEMWKKLEEQIGESGPAIVSALKKLYAVYTPNVVTWLANLYEPYSCLCGECTGEIACNGGGFYYSNSGRDTPGYYIDAESTIQALGLLKNMGLTYDLADTAYTSMTPEWMEKQMVAFVRSLQRQEDGFFYHIVQGPGEVSNLRRARDLSWCESILNAYGARPKYTTPTGRTGNSALTGPLGQSATALASRVVASASYASHLESVETITEYLNKITSNGTTSSFYGPGSTMTSEMPQVVARDAQLGFTGANFGAEGSLVDAVVDFFDKYQDPATGLWPNTSAYNALDGVLKISGIYNKAHRAIPNAEKTFAAGLAAIVSEAPLGNAVHSYNPWNGTINVISNVRNYGDSATVNGKLLTAGERADTMKAELFENMPLALERTADKIKVMWHEDGSFSYNVNGTSPANSCGLPVSTGAVEGDVNGTHLLLGGVLGAAYSGIGVGEAYKVPLFGRAERFIFLDILENLGPVQKIEDEGDEVFTEPETYDDFNIDEHPYGNASTVVKFPGSENKVLEFNDSSSSNSNSMNVPFNTYQSGANLFGYKLKMYVDSKGTSSGTVLQVTMANAAMFYLKKSGTDLQFVESSSGDNPHNVERGLTTVKCDEWFTIEAKYFTGTNETVRIKWYVNGELLAVTDNYFSKSGGKLFDADVTPPKPTATKNKILFWGLKSSTVKLYLDDVDTYALKEVYTPETATDLVYNVDLISDMKTHTFEDNTVPAELVLKNESCATAANGELTFNGGGFTSTVQHTYSGGNAVSFETKIKATDLSGEVMTIQMKEKFRGNIAVKVVLKVTEVEGVKYLQAVNGIGTVANINGALLALDGEYHTIRIDYFTTTDIAVYVDGTLCSVIKSGLSNAQRYVMNTLDVSFGDGKSVTLDDVKFYDTELVVPAVPAA